MRDENKPYKKVFWTEKVSFNYWQFTIALLFIAALTTIIIELFGD